MSPRQAIAVFSKPVFTASILNLREKGRDLKFTNPGRVATEGATDDPDGSISQHHGAQLETSRIFSVLTQFDN